MRLDSSYLRNLGKEDLLMEATQAVSSLQRNKLLQSHYDSLRSCPRELKNRDSRLACGVELDVLTMYDNLIRLLHGRAEEGNLGGREGQASYTQECFCGSIREKEYLGGPWTEDENSTLKLSGPEPSTLFSDSTAHLVVCLLSEGQNNLSHFLMPAWFPRAVVRKVLLM